MSGLRASSPQRSWQSLLLPGSLIEASDTNFIGETVEPLKAGDKRGVAVTVYIYGQPPIDLRGIAERAEIVMLEYGFDGAKIKTSSTFPLAWSWAYNATKEAWKPYVTNSSAGAFVSLFDIKSRFGLEFVSYVTPDAESLRLLPTQGYVLEFFGTRSKAMTAEERAKFNKAIEPKRPLGTSLAYGARYYNVPASQTSWLFGLLMLGGLAYASQK